MGPSTYRLPSQPLIWPNPLLRVLRWVALGIAFVLNLFTEGPSGFAHEPEWVILFLAAYMLCSDLARARFRIAIAHSLLLLAADTLVVTLGIFLAGGWHSSLFAVYFPLVLGAVVHLGFAEALAWTTILSVLYTAVCLSLPNWSGRLEEVETLAARLASLALEALVGAAFTREGQLAQLRRTQQAAKIEQLEELNEQKTHFLSTVSHEFRTPLTAISSAVGLLLDSSSNLTSEQRALVRNVQRNAARLGGLVADLLEMARLREGKAMLRRRRLDVHQAAREVGAALQPLFDAKRQTLRFEFEPDLPAPLADRQRIDHILTNLLSNAHRHGPAGSEVRLRVTGAGAACLRFTVTDHGEGVPAEEREAIFDPFYARRDESGGIGLGLTIARSLAELHSGRLWVESSSSQGASFVFELPIEPEGSPDEDSDR